MMRPIPCEICAANGGWVLKAPMRRPPVPVKLQTHRPTTTLSQNCTRTHTHARAQGGRGGEGKGGAGGGGEWRRGGGMD